MFENIPTLSQRVLVLGESCVDSFVYCHANRLAPDLPVPVLNVDKIENNPGMAMNVHASLKKYIYDCEIKTNPNWDSITKTRYVHNKSNHTFFRVDSDANFGIFSEDIDYSTMDLIVISDYNKGYLSEQKISEICEKNSNVFLDTKKRVGDWAAKARFIKINDFEYQNSLPIENFSLSQKIIRTLGSRGCEYQGDIFSVPEVEVKDSSGAGDAFMAGLVVGYLISGSIVEAIKLANLGASKVVSERGVTTI